jgi:hypothetical protein
MSVVREVVGWPERSSSTTLALSLWNLPIHWYTFLCITQFSPYCANNDSTLLNNGTIRNRSRHVCTMTARAALNVTTTPTTCLDLAQRVVRLMSARVQSDKLPGFYK